VTYMTAHENGVVIVRHRMRAGGRDVGEEGKAERLESAGSTPSISVARTFGGAVARTRCSCCAHVPCRSGRVWCVAITTETAEPPSIRHLIGAWGCTRCFLAACAPARRRELCRWVRLPQAVLCAPWSFACKHHGRPCACTPHAQHMHTACSS